MTEFGMIEHSKLGSYGVVGKSSSCNLETQV
jgi:hypothetical protein